MSSKLDFTIDVGSSKLRLAITQKTNKFNKVLSLIEKEYDGFSDSEFFNPLSVKLIVADLITEAVKSACLASFAFACVSVLVAHSQRRRKFLRRSLILFLLAVVT